MDWGLHFPSHIDSWKWVSHGEEKGFSYYMPYDSIGSDVYETLALCAANTKKDQTWTWGNQPKIKNGTCYRTCNGNIKPTSSGEGVFGFGTGNTARRAWGMPIAKLEEVKEEVEIFRKMFKGEEALYSEGPNRYMFYAIINK